MQSGFHPTSDAASRRSRRRAIRGAITHVRRQELLVESPRGKRDDIVLVAELIFYGRKMPANRSRYDQTRNSSIAAKTSAMGRPSGAIKI